MGDVDDDRQHRAKPWRVVFCTVTFCLDWLRQNQDNRGCPECDGEEQSDKITGHRLHPPLRSESLGRWPTVYSSE